MTREEHLLHCKICTHQKFDSKQGIVCDLTDRIADFEGSCPSFVLNESKKEIEEMRTYNQLPRLNTASQGKRFANYILDLVFIVIFSSLFGLTIGIIFVFVDPSLLSYFEDDNTLLDYVFDFIIGMIYYSIMEGMSGKSIAKFITKTKVVDLKGDKPDFSTIFVRSLCRFIPFDAFSYLGSDAIGWHDQISKTRVVEIDPSPYQQY